MRTPSLSDLPKVYRSGAVRAAEQVAMARFGLDEDDLMARAGLAAWRLLLDRWPQAQRIGIVCGPGNNGGDGYVLAELARSSGRHVFVLRLGDTVKPGASQRAAEAYAQAGGELATFTLDEGLPRADVWVDALFGIGLHRGLDGLAADVVAALNHGRATPVLALDVPSGVDADTGDDRGLSVRATVTLTFIAGKPGLFTGRGRAAAGEVVVDPLGLADHMFDDLEPAACLVRAPALARWLAPRDRDAHKGRFGTVLCLGGDRGTGGAIALCAEAAHRVGAGLVSAATRAEHVPVLLARRPETMVRAVDDAPGDAPDRADALRSLLERCTVIAVGPGLGGGAWSRSLLDAALAAERPTVIDADALNLLAAMPGTGADFADAVLTPHPGEAARLLDRPIAELEADRLGAARTLAARYGGTVVWKGAGTVVSAPDGVPVIVDAGNPGMAAGGMGDVLTGAIAGLLAQGLAPFDAAVCGALLHAAAGDAAAAEGGERGLLPSDLFPHLRRLANPAVRA
ncbi:MAG: NAD(P)H-hydrate dehydratase [Xanthomonadales bacterium]|nr:NAD(P)H-hydrate dehydratase [Xanthomonadales bacterium]